MSKLLLIGALIVCFPSIVFSQELGGELDLCSQNITSVDQISNVVRNAPEDILHLNLCNNDLLNIDTKWFQRFNRLEKLILDGNSRLQFNSNGFEFLMLKRLTDLQCFRCGVDKIYNKSLQGMPRLEQIRLTHNIIEEIEVKAFYANMNLESIDLRFNKLRRLPSEMLTPLVSIRRIDLSSNTELSPEGSEPFLISTVLEKLSCDECGFVTVQEHTFAKLQGLKELFLRRNKISRIHGLALSQVTLMTLMLEGNALKSIDLRILSVANLKICLDNNTNELECFLKDKSNQAKFLCSSFLQEDVECMVPSTTTLEVTNDTTDPVMPTLHTKLMETTLQTTPKTTPKTTPDVTSIAPAQTTDNLQGISGSFAIGHLIFAYLTLIVIFVLLVGIWFKLKKKDTTLDSKRFTGNIASQDLIYESVYNDFY